MRSAISRILFRTSLLWLSGSLFAATAQTPQAFDEYELKAVFLFRFTQFVEWPSEDRETFSICILGNDPFDRHLSDVVRGESVANKTITISHRSKLDELSDCQILFVGDSERANFKKIVTALRNSNVLTVSDGADFAPQGGMIELSTEAKRIRLKINPDAARAADLQLSSKLLRSATIVATEKG